MKRKFLLAACFLLYLVSDIQSQSFDDVQVGADSYESMITLSRQNKNALSIFTNPGLSGRSDHIYVDVMRIKFADTATSYLGGIVVPVDNSFTVGIAAHRFFNENILSTQAPVAPENKVSFNHNLFLFSFGRNIGSGVSIGFSMKAIQQTIGGDRSNIVPGEDLSIMYALPDVGVFAQTTILAAVKNISQQKIEFGSKTIIIPRMYRLGFEKTVNMPGGNLVLSYNLNYSKFTEAQYRAGIGYNIHKIGTASIGWDENQRLCLSGGIFLGDFHFSATHIATHFKSFYSLSLGYSFKSGQN